MSPIWQMATCTAGGKCYLTYISVFSFISLPFPNSEVFKALNKTRGLYLRWRELGENGGTEAEWTTTELRNSLRSIEWDLEDLEDTINILLQRPLKNQFVTWYSTLSN